MTVNNTMRQFRHLLCLDVESWIFSKAIVSKNFTISELRKLDDGYTLRALTYALNTLRRYDQKITFFVAVKLEELYPGFIEKILADGHEVGWHTYSHATITSRKILQEELDRSADVIEKYKIRGFQAPAITFIREGYSLLREYGFLYSSSLYGDSNAVYNFDGIFEIPVSVSRPNLSLKEEDIMFPSHMKPWNFLRYGIPFGSSFFWSLLRTPYYVHTLQRAQEQRRVCNLFIHEWQLVPFELPQYRHEARFLSHPLFYFYRKNVSTMFEHLLSAFSFGRCIDYLQEVTRPPA